MHLSDEASSDPEASGLVFNSSESTNASSVVLCIENADTCAVVSEVGGSVVKAADAEVPVTENVPWSTVD